MALRRASEKDRDQAVAALQKGWLTGALSTDTFEARLEVALGARDNGQLRRITRDLPNWIARFRAAVREAITAEPPSAPLELRACDDADDLITIGRHRSCGRVYDDASVSRQHALLRRVGPAWKLYDLDSTNGTWLNGRRVTGGVPVTSGDEIQVGRVRLAFRPTAAPAPIRRALDGGQS